MNARHRLHPLFAFLFLLLILPGCAGTRPWLIVADRPPIMPGIGVGPVRFGMNAEEIFRELGRVKPTNASSYPMADGTQAVESREYSYEGKHLHFEVFSTPNTGLQRITLAAHATYAKLPVLLTPRTDRGIGLGSNREQLLVAYGEPTSTKVIGQDVRMEYPSLGMEFNINPSNKISSISMQRPKLALGHLPEDLLKEFEASHKQSLPSLTTR